MISDTYTWVHVWFHRNLHTQDRELHDIELGLDHRDLELQTHKDKGDKGNEFYITKILHSNYRNKTIGIKLEWLRMNIIKTTLHLTQKNKFAGKITVIAVSLWIESQPKDYV